MKKTEDDSKLHEHYSFIADQGQQPLRIDKYLMNFIENATRNKIQLAIKAGNVLVNDTTVKSNHKVKPNDVVRVVLAHPPHENLLVAENIPINIVYEDDTVIVVNKPAGVVVHPTSGNWHGTLLNGLLEHFQSSGGIMTGVMCVSIVFDIFDVLSAVFFFATLVKSRVAKFLV